VKLSPEEWHRRFKQQARWTQQLRRHLFRDIHLSSHSKILEIGCGTGAVLEEFESEISPPQKHAFSRDQGFPGEIYGLDIDFIYLKLAGKHVPNARYTMGDAISLPYASNSFIVTFCHYFLLWIGNPTFAISEMVRVTRPGGFVIAFAEPDYGGRIDYPPDLELMGNLQRESLYQQGANPRMGRQLLHFFNSNGLKDLQSGVMGNQRKGRPSDQEIGDEWAVFLADISSSAQMSKANSLRELEKNAWLEGSRILYVPTFYAMGRVKE
jgi:ubiquinone/menaquinone biosynthesis C-methylase UbiE